MLAVYMLVCVIRRGTVFLSLLYREDGVFKPLRQRKSNELLAFSPLKEFIKIMKTYRANKVVERIGAFLKGIENQNTETVWKYMSQHFGLLHDPLPSLKVCSKEFCKTTSW